MNKNTTCVALMAAVSLPAHATLLTWESTSPNNTWDTTATGIWAQNVAWDNQAPDDADFLGTPETVLLGADITAQSIFFGVDGFVLSTAGHSLTTADLILDGSFTKDGPGTLAVSGSITGASTGALAIAGGMLELNPGAETGGAQNPAGSYAGSFDIGADGTLKITTRGSGLNATAFTMPRPLTGTGTLEVSHGGTGTREVRLTGGGQGFTGTVKVGVTTNQNLRLTSGADEPFLESPFGEGAVIELGERSQIWTTLVRGVPVNLRITQANAANNFDTLGSIRVFGSNQSLSGTIAILGAEARIDSANIAGADIHSDISGPGKLILGGWGATTAMTLHGNSSYLGGTDLGNGTFILNHSNALGTTGTINFNGGILRHSANNAVDYSARLSTADRRNHRIDTNGQQVTWATPLASSGAALNKFGDGSLGFSSSAPMGAINVVGSSGGSTLDILGNVTIGLGNESLLQTNGGTVSGTVRSTVNIHPGATLTVNSQWETIIGQNSQNHDGVLNVNGTYRQTASGLLLGNNRADVSGTVNVNDGGLLTFDSPGLFVVGRDLGKAAVNLNAGGILETRTVVQGDTGVGIGNANAGTTRVFSFNGGTFRALAPGAGIAGMTSATFGSAGGIIDTAGFDVSIAQPFSGSGGLTKEGTGTLIMSGNNSANPYAGATVVKGGMLSLNHPGLHDSSTVRIATGAQLELFHGEIDVVGALYLGNGSALPNGDYTTANTGGMISGSTLRVVAPNVADFAAWISGAAFGIASGEQDFEDDPDHDGLSNGIENVLGSHPGQGNPGLEQVAGGTGSLGFRHALNATVASDVTYHYEWSTDLANWKLSGETDPAGVTAQISAAPPAGGNVQVTVTVSGGPSTKIFARLVAEQ